MMSPALSTAEHLENCFRLVWNVDKLRDVQLEILAAIFYPSNKRKQLIVQPIARGKTHIMRVMGTMFWGLHVVVHPLFALTVDQASAFEEGNDAYGSIQVHNLDAHASESKTVWRKIINRMLATKLSTYTTTFLLCSSQFITIHNEFNEALIQCNKNRTL